MPRSKAPARRLDQDERQDRQWNMGQQDGPEPEPASQPVPAKKRKKGEKIPRHPEAEKKFSALAAKFDAAAFYVPVALDRAFLTKAEGEYTATLGQFRFGVEAGAVGEGWNEVIADSKEIWLYLSSIPLMSFAYAERYTQVICFDFFV